MKKRVSAIGSATIINAIATGYGSAFGIDLDIILDFKSTNNGEMKFSSDIGASTNLMEICVKNVLNYFNISNEDISFEIKTKSNLPMSSGLSSSSALSNGIVLGLSSIISHEFNKKPLDDFDIINLAIDSSLEAGVTITGAFDDATASYFGGVTVTNNEYREIIHKENMDELPVLVFMPNFHSSSADSDVSKMKLLSPLVETAFEIAKSGDYFKALNLNGLIYASALNFNSQIAIEALSSGAYASGLSGTGSSFIAVCEEEHIDDIKESWSQFEGEIIETKINNKGCVFK
ncbi:shikimate kinase [Methanobrevibacter sp. DSM 116169]|uniref:shikimate kinase n=1 Tax=Methanobrevibacter sp. DSM 116169 TaxID=3242727 RepID=UPI0038FC9346